MVHLEATTRPIAPWPIYTHFLAESERIHSRLCRATKSCARAVYRRLGIPTIQSSVLLLNVYLVMLIGIRDGARLISIGHRLLYSVVTCIRLSA